MVRSRKEESLEAGLVDLAPREGLEGCPVRVLQALVAPTSQKRKETGLGAQVLAKLFGQLQ